MTTLGRTDDERRAAADSRWRDHAACRGRTVLFFPKKAERPQARERREAKALRLCDECPVREPCQEFARQNREYGFWAGESEEERHLAGFTVAAPIGIRAREARTVQCDDVHHLDDVHQLDDAHQDERHDEQRPA